MADQIEPFELDMLKYEQLCKEHGKPYTEDEAEDYAMSVANRVIDGGQSEEVAWLEVWDEFSTRVL